MWHSIDVDFADDHPTAAGHFPAEPIIPGAVLLDEVVRAIDGKGDSGGPVVIRAAKFFCPVRPGERICVRWRVLGDRSIGFECRLFDPDRLAAAGSITIGRVAS